MRKAKIRGKWMFLHHPPVRSDHGVEPVIGEHAVPREDHREKRNFMSRVYGAHDPGCGTIRH